MTDHVPMRAKTHKKKPLLSRYLDALGLHDAAVARLCGLSRTNIARARYSSLNAENSEQLSRCLAGELGLSEEERQFLKAESELRPSSSTYVCPLITAFSEVGDAGIEPVTSTV